MGLSERLEQIVIQLRPAFRREATFQWFVILLWGIVLSTQAPAVTSYTVSGNRLHLFEALKSQS
jgi:hypothetical protein